jgi:hypothetical protein
VRVSNAHAAFGETVGRIAGHRPVLVYGSDIDYTAAAALLDHLLGRDLRAEESALEVDRHHLVVLRLGCLEDRGASFDAGVVHHYVDTTELLHRRINEFLKVGTLAHVSRNANGLAAKFADLPLERLGRFRMDQVIDDDAGLLTRQFENDR